MSPIRLQKRPDGVVVLSGRSSLRLPGLQKQGEPSRSAAAKHFGIGASEGSCCLLLRAEFLGLLDDCLSMEFQLSLKRENLLLTRAHAASSALVRETSGGKRRGKPDSSVGWNWWTWSGSNRRPLPCHGSALPAAPQAHVWRDNSSIVVACGLFVKPGEDRLAEDRSGSRERS